MSVNRRAVLALGAGAALAVAVPATAQAAPLTGKLRELERQHNARLGVFATDTGTGRTVLHRADELFPMCSTFKTVVAAAILRRDHDGTLLGKVIRYTKDDCEKSGYAKITEKPENLANGMTVSALCEATITYSDNCAANLLLKELGGPTAITRFSRSIGDPVTRLDRWEPELNSAEPGRVTDTTSPRAIRTHSTGFEAPCAAAKIPFATLTGSCITGGTYRQITPSTPGSARRRRRHLA